MQPFPFSSTEKDQDWHVVYTRPKAEKKAATRIAGLGMEVFLPLHKVVRQWSDRKKKVEVPLFANYVFIKVANSRRFEVLSIREIVKFVSFEGRPTVVSEAQIQVIKQLLQAGECIRSEDFFEEGMTVRITQGQFAGLKGVIVKKNGSARLVVKIDGIMKALSLNVPSYLAEILNS